MPLIMVLIAVLFWMTIGTVAAVLYGVGWAVVRTLNAVAAVGGRTRRLSRRTS